MSSLAEVWIGTSGYVYRHWRKGVFYPSGLPAREELGYYASRFRTVELNNPFYRLPTPEMFDRWRESTPSGFQFSVKASRFITHIKRLRSVSDELALFLERADRLGPKLGPILFQLPPTQQIDRPRLVDFLALLSPGHRWVIEFRHPSWHAREVYQLPLSHISACTEGKSQLVGSPGRSSARGRHRSARFGFGAKRSTSTSTTIGRGTQ